MGREWKPGDVAATDYRGCESRAFVVEGTSCVRDHPRAPHWHGKSGGWNELRDPLVTYRPLVVIDPEDEEDVARLAEILRTTVASLVRGEAMQAALREYANPTPPKPEEPTGLYARVEDAEGRIWVRTAEQSSVWRRECKNGDGRRYLIPQDGCEFYRDIAAVRVLSEGVTA